MDIHLIYRTAEVRHIYFAYSYFAKSSCNFYFHNKILFSGGEKTKQMEQKNPKIKQNKKLSLYIKGNKMLLAVFLFWIVIHKLGEGVNLFFLQGLDKCHYVKISNNNTYLNLD